MAVFPRDADTTHPADFALVRDGGLAAYRDEADLAVTERDLMDIGYRVVNLDASAWDDESELHRDIASGLGFPFYYGRNIAALNDCLGDVAHGDYGWQADASGLCVSIRHFASIATRAPRTATTVTDLFAAASRLGLLFGHRLVWLLHVNDPGVTMEQVGCRAIPWCEPGHQCHADGP